MNARPCPGRGNLANMIFSAIVHGLQVNPIRFIESKIGENIENVKGKNTKEVIPQSWVAHASAPSGSPVRSSVK